MGRTNRSTSSVTGALLDREQNDVGVAENASVAEKVDQSLPPLDISLISDIKNGEHDSQPMNEELRKALEGGAARRSGRGRRRTEHEPIELDPAYLHNPEQMNYALLLALLLREGGVVKLTQRDLERADDEHNILFALSLDGKLLEVSVVSTESGIIRHPEAKWAQSQIPNYSPPPRPGAIAERIGLPPYADESPNGNAGLAPASLDPGRLVQMPSPQELRIPGTPPEARRQAQPGETGGGGPPGYVFPFETGQSPQSATMNLDSLQSELAKDRMLALEQQRAAAKVEGQG